MLDSHCDVMRRGDSAVPAARLVTRHDGSADITCRERLGERPTFIHTNKRGDARSAELTTCPLRARVSVERCKMSQAWSRTETRGPRGCSSWSGKYPICLTGDISPREVSARYTSMSLKGTGRPIHACAKATVRGAEDPKIQKGLTLRRGAKPHITH